MSLPGWDAGLIIVAEIVAAWVAVAKLVSSRSIHAREEAAVASVQAVFRETADDEPSILAAREKLRRTFLDGFAGEGSAANAVAHQGTAVADIVRSYWLAARVGGLPETGAAVSAAEARLLAALELPRTISGSLVLVGLGGTLLGLTRAVIGINTHPSTELPTSSTPGAAALSQQIQSVNTLLGGVETTIGGMRTAFIPALCAVVLTLALLLVLHQAKARETHVLALLDEVSGAMLRPLFRPVDHRAAFELPAETRKAERELVAAIVKAAQVLTNAASTTRSELTQGAKSAEKGIAGAIATGLKAIEERTLGLENAAKEAGRALAAPVNDAVALVAHAGREASGLLQVAAEKAAASSAEVAGATVRLDSKLNDVGEIADRLSAAAGQGARVADALQKGESRIAQALKVIGRQVERSRLTADNAARSVSAPLINAVSDLQRMRDLLASLLVEQQNLRRELLPMLRTQGDLAETLARTLAESHEVGGRPAPTGDLISAEPLDMSAGAVQRMADYLLERLAIAHEEPDERWRRRTNGLVQRLTAQYEAVGRMLERANTMLDTHHDILQAVQRGLPPGEPATPLQPTKAHRGFW
ncbi:MAG TPA: hypothetical protein VFH27_04550, partial [Longimicrobiaceae bacterium]|nr:hypothetical protein [Longimicrobiaceae bacterium]